MRPIFLAMLVPLAACGHNDSAEAAKPGVKADGTGSQRTYPVDGFTAIDLRGPDDIDVRVGAGFSVRAEGDPAELDKLRITREGDSLRVDRVRKSGFSWSSGKGVKIYVTMPRITAATLAGSGDLAVDRAEGARFDGALAGSGNLSIATLAVREAKLSIAGSGNVSAGGSADMLGLDIAGSGDIAAQRLTARQADVSIAGSGNVTATVKGNATVSIAGSGDVDLGGDARCQTSKMGSGTVRCG